MKQPNRRIDRRQFIARTGTGLVALSSLTGLSSCALCSRLFSGAPSMPMRTLGKTGMKVSILSFGGGSQFLANPDGEWEPMLEKAVEAGINLFDTSSDYQWKASLTSEERFGHVLSGHRDRILLSTKCVARDADGARRECEQSLKRMKTDHLDIYMIHSIEKSEDIAALEKGAYAALRKLKEEGVVRAIGFSCMNSADKSRELLEKLELDVVLLAMNATRYGHFVRKALPVARKKNVGVIAMKAMRNLVGKAARAEELLNYAWTQGGVASACVGHLGENPLEENIRIAVNFNDAKALAFNRPALEERLAPLAGPHALCWARPDYFDGAMC